MRELRLEPEPPEPERPRVRGRRRRVGARPAPDDGSPVEMLDDDALEVNEADLEPVGTPARAAAGLDDGTMPFHIDEDLFSGAVVAEAGGPAPAESVGDPRRFLAEEPSRPAALFGGADPGPDAGPVPVIDRDEEVPDRYWDPEVASIGRRAGALLVDQALLALLVGVFFLGALVALELSGFDTNHLLASSGLRAAAPPFALLAVLLSLAGHTFFHGYAQRSPGKALVGIEVRTAAGAVPSWGRVVLRWCGAALGLGLAGVGWAWALFEPRRRGWADLFSGTVVTLRRPADSGAASRR